MEEQLDIFDLFDHKGDHKVQVSDIGQVLRALGQNPTNKEVG